MYIIMLYILKLLWMAQFFLQIQYFEEHLCSEMYFLRKKFI